MPLKKRDLKNALILDSREPESVIRVFEKASPWGVVIEKLDYGDISGKHIIVERKHFPDLYQSIRSMRIWDQIQGLCDWADEHKMLPVLGIHGGAYELPVQINMEMIYGAIASLAIRYGVHIIWTDHLWDLAVIIVKMEKKMRQGRLGQPRKPRVRRLSNEKVREAYVMATLFQIPYQTAWQIMEKGGLRWLLEASDYELLSVRGIGKKALQRIRRLIGYPKKRQG